MSIASQERIDRKKNVFLLWEVKIFCDYFKRSI